LAKGKQWELTLEQFIFATLDKSCHYCAEALPKAGSGLDRKDNNIGYTVENVVPCCTRCNKMKNSYLTYDEMVLIWELRLRDA